MYWNFDRYMVGMHAFWWAFWLILIAVVVLGARGRWSGRRDATPESPRDILQRRLASGEIDPDEYQQRLALLNKQS
jgi:putative membrane protein